MQETKMKSILLLICLLGFVAILKADKPAWQPISTPSPVRSFMSRAATSQTCQNSSLTLCNPDGVSHVCCPSTDMCCNDANGVDAYCVTEGGSCCDGGGGCDAGFDCCGLGCIPSGAVCCSDQTGFCPTNHTCIEPQVDGEQWLCSSASPLSMSFSLSFFLLFFYVFTQHF